MFAIQNRFVYPQLQDCHSESLYIQNVAVNNFYRNEVIKFQNQTGLAFFDTTLAFPDVTTVRLSIAK